MQVSVHEAKTNLSKLIEILPLHHRNPFDRMLVAQAQLEGLNLMSIDTTLDDYDVKRVW